LQVPPSIFAEESNYLLNPLHTDIVKILGQATEKFSFDERFVPIR